MATLRQLTTWMKNEPGTLAEAADKLGDAGININHGNKRKRQFPPSNPQPNIGERALLRFASSITIPQRLFSVMATLAASVVTGVHAAEVTYTPPIPIVTKEALYPVNSLATGTVTLTVVVEEDGRVSEAKVLKSIPSLDEPSVRAARQWRFKPARLDGRRVRSTASISFVYDRGLFRTVGKPRK